MTEKSLAEQIVDEFVEKVSESGILAGNKLESLKTACNSEAVDKNRITEILKEGDADENPGTDN